MVGSTGQVFGSFLELTTETLSGSVVLRTSIVSSGPQDPSNTELVRTFSLDTGVWVPVDRESYSLEGGIVQE